MKIIQKLEELMEEELHDMEKYARMAAELKAEHPSIANTFYTLSAQEESHVSALHDEVVKIISQYKPQNGEPPAAMAAVYDYLHKRHLEKMADAKRMQDIYRNK